MKKQQRNRQIPRVVINTGKTLQAIYPGLASAFAIKLFKSPMRFPMPEVERNMFQKSRKRFERVPGHSKKVLVYAYGQGSKKALLVHGWSGRGTQLFAIADQLVELGYTVYSFDAPAHGKSSGRSTTMLEFISTIIHCQDSYGPFDVAIGHSLGGMSLLNSTKFGFQCPAMVSIGAGDVISDIMQVFLQKLELRPQYIVKMKQSFYKTFKEDIDNYSTSKAAKGITSPVLIIHDTEDREVPVSCAHSIRQKLQAGDLHITDGLGHNRILKSPDICRRIVAFLNTIQS